MCGLKPGADGFHSRELHFAPVDDPCAGRFWTVGCHGTGVATSKGSILLAKSPVFPEMIQAVTNKQMLPRCLESTPIKAGFERVEAGSTDLSRSNRLPES